MLVTTELAAMMIEVAVQDSFVLQEMDFLSVMKIQPILRLYQIKNVCALTLIGAVLQILIVATLLLYVAPKIFAYFPIIAQ